MTRIMNILILVCGLVSISVTVQAKDGEAGMTFRGMLIVPPPCKINDDSRVDVDFGERVGVNKVDGVNYRQSINYQVSCENVGNNNWILILSLLGEHTLFDNGALVTNKENLGIRIYQNDKIFAPDSHLLIDPMNPPKLEAVPVKNLGTTLVEGDFEAWATLQANYQ
ncbi:UNVERIFIED_ORG: type 1 fimbria pilin [Providencia alcalifaciens]